MLGRGHSPDFYFCGAIWGLHGPQPFGAAAATGGSIFAHPVALDGPAVGPTDSPVELVVAVHPVDPPPSVPATLRADRERCSTLGVGALASELESDSFCHEVSPFQFWYTHSIHYYQTSVKCLFETKDQSEAEDLVPRER